MKFPFSSHLPELTPEQETERRQELSDLKTTLSDRLVMVGTAFVCLFLPCMLILILLGLASMWLFGLL